MELSFMDFTALPALAVSAISFPFTSSLIPPHSPHLFLFCAISDVYSQIIPFPSVSSHSILIFLCQHALCYRSQSMSPTCPLGLPWLMALLGLVWMFLEVRLKPSFRSLRHDCWRGTYKINHLYLPLVLGGLIFIFISWLFLKKNFF